MELLISFLVGIAVYMLLSVLITLLQKDTGPKGHVKRYYAFIKGDTRPKQLWRFKLLGLNHEGTQYALDTKKYVYYALPICTGIFLFMLFFFRSFAFSLVISLVGMLYPRIILMGIINKRKNLLNDQLKEAMYSLSSSLRAGASLQKALERCVDDLERIYVGDKEAPIVVEFRRMKEELEMGYSVDETLQSFCDRVRLEDVDDFVNATLIAKSRGGNLTEILSNISRTISEKIEIKQEIRVMTAGKQMEAKILSFMPIGIVVCLTLLSPEYMQPMYNSLMGRLLLFLGFILIAINYFVSRKIVNIDV